jgi:hypothetical protein
MTEYDRSKHVGAQSPAANQDTWQRKLADAALGRLESEGCDREFIIQLIQRYFEYKSAAARTRDRWRQDFSDAERLINAITKSQRRTINVLKHEASLLFRALSSSSGDALAHSTLEAKSRRICYGVRNAFYRQIFKTVLNTPLDRERWMRAQNMSATDPELKRLFIGGEPTAVLYELLTHVRAKTQKTNYGRLCTVFAFYGNQLKSSEAWDEDKLKKVFQRFPRRFPFFAAVIRGGRA